MRQQAVLPERFCMDLVMTVFYEKKNRGEGLVK
jgi:hypothetical protein